MIYPRKINTFSMLRYVKTCTFSMIGYKGQGTRGQRDWFLWPSKSDGNNLQSVRTVIRQTEVQRVSGTSPCATRCTFIYKRLATCHIKCGRNCQWDERRFLGVGVQALSSNPLQAAAVGNVAVVSVAERCVLLSWAQMNHSMRCR